MTSTLCPFCLAFNRFDFGAYMLPFTMACAHSTSVVLSVELPCFVMEVVLRLSPLDYSPHVSPVKEAYSFAFGKRLKSDVST